MDIEELIYKEFKHCYEIMPMEEVGSSQYAAVVEYEVCKEELNEFELCTIKNLYSGTPEKYTLSEILKYMANKELIEEGSYIIDVSW